jgi:hypothetical protein
LFHFSRRKRWRRNRKSGRVDGFGKRNIRKNISSLVKKKFVAHRVVGIGTGGAGEYGR